MKTHDGERTGKISIIFLVGTVGRRGFCISEALLRGLGVESWLTPFAVFIQHLITFSQAPTDSFIESQG